MQESSTFSRRQLLTTAGTGTGIALAGCLGQSGSGSQGGQGNTRQVTALVQADPEEMIEREEELMDQVENGEIDPVDAQQELVEFEQTIISTSMEFVSSEVESNGGEVEDTVPNQGAMLLNGPDSLILDLLENEQVQAITPGTFFAEVEQLEQRQRQQRQQRQQQQQQSQQLPQEDEEEPTDNEQEDTDQEDENGENDESDSDSE